MAKTGKFKCSACSRTFSMAAHLGRHMTTIHGAKGAQAKVKSRVQPRQNLRSGIDGVVAQIRTYRDKLATERAEIDSQLDAMDNALATLDGTVRPAMKHVAGGRRGGGGARAGSLKEFVLRVLRGRARPMRVKDITAAVRKAGYATKNRTLEKSVGNALAATPQVVKVARGQYRLRG